jgi:hypothetical protein
MKRTLFSGLFFAAAFSALPARADATKSQLYKDLVAPVLEAKCNKCHGTEKPKGKLSMVSVEAILKGGNEGPAVVAGKVDESPLLQRVFLPMSDDEHMPPEDKEQLTEQETALLSFWIGSGAKATGTVAEFKPDEKALAAANHVLGNLPKAAGTVAKADAPKVDPAMEKLVKETIGRVEKTGASLMAIAQDTPELRFSALNVSKEFNDDKLAELKPIASQIKWMDLARTQVTDKGLAHVAGMANLSRLHLENTAVTDAGLDSLKGLANLEYLNLYGTQISDAGLAKLSELKNLKKVFVWQSKVTDAGAGWKEPQAQPVALAANTTKPAMAAAPAPAPAAKPATPAPAPAPKPAAPAPAPAAKPATPAPTTPAPAPKPTTPAPAPAPAAAPAKPAVDPMFQKAVTEVEAAATEAAKRAAQAKTDFDTAIKAVEEATKRAEALKVSSEKATAVAAETKAALDQLKKAVETSKK